MLHGHRRRRLRESSSGDKVWVGVMVCCTVRYCRQQNASKWRLINHAAGSAAAPAAAVEPASPSSGSDGGAAAAGGDAAMDGPKSVTAAAAAEKAGREDWMTTPMGRPLAEAPEDPAKPDRQRDAEEKATIAAVRDRRLFNIATATCRLGCVRLSLLSRSLHLGHERGVRKLVQSSRWFSSQLWKP